MKHSLFISGFLILLNIQLIFSVGLNLSFETNSCSAVDCNYDAPNVTIPNWLVESGDVDLTSGLVWNAHSGNWSLDLNGLVEGTVTQTLAVTPGSSYTLTFFMSGNPGGDFGIKILRVNVTGNAAQNYSVDTSGLTPTSMAWTQKTYSFTASASTVTLSFASMSTGTSYGPTIDLVNIIEDPSPSPTPSPSISISPSRTPSPTNSPSVSPSRTPSPSLSPSLTPSPTISISPTPSPSLGSSPSSSPSVTPSHSPANSVSPSSSPSSTPSVSPSVTPTISPSNDPSTTPSPSGIINSSPSPIISSGSSFPTPSVAASESSDPNQGSGDKLTRSENATIAAAILIPIGTMLLALILVVLKHGPCGACGRLILSKLSGEGNDVEMQ